MGGPPWVGLPHVVETLPSQEVVRLRYHHRYSLGWHVLTTTVTLPPLAQVTFPSPPPTPPQVVAGSSPRPIWGMGRHKVARFPSQPCKQIWVRQEWPVKAGSAVAGRQGWAQATPPTVWQGQGGPVFLHLPGLPQWGTTHPGKASCPWQGKNSINKGNNGWGKVKSQGKGAYKVAITTTHHHHHHQRIRWVGEAGQVRQYRCLQQKPNPRYLHTQGLGKARGWGRKHGVGWGMARGQAGVGHGVGSWEKPCSRCRVCSRRWQKAWGNAGVNHHRHRQVGAGGRLNSVPQLSTGTMEPAAGKLGQPAYSCTGRRQFQGHNNLPSPPGKGTGLTST